MTGKKESRYLPAQGDDIQMLMNALGVVFQAVECNFSHLQMAIIGKHPEKNSLMAVPMQQRIIGKLMSHAKQIFLHSFIWCRVRYRVRCWADQGTACASFCSFCSPAPDLHS